MSRAIDDRQALIKRYRRNRARSRALFDLVAASAYDSRPISLRHPIVFYEGHLPAFTFNTLVKRALGGSGIDARLEALFARGIDPHERAGGTAGTDPWPPRAEVLAFADEVDRQVIGALSDQDLDRPGDPLLDRAEAVFAVLEHEEMHHETMLYMWHRLPFETKTAPSDYRPVTDARVPGEDWMTVPFGRATLGADRSAILFGWDNEQPGYQEDVPAFRIERHDVTNARFAEFIEAGGYTDERWWTPDDWAWRQRDDVKHPLFWERAGDTWLWRGMFDRVPLPMSWPVYVSQAEASAYAAWRGDQLPTEAQFQRAAYGSATGERTHPWGSAEPSAAHGVFDFNAWDPHPAGSHPDGSSAWGVEDLVGNGWEWTRTSFGPFPGFHPMASYPEYSADFFDGQHFVMKGASPGTARELLRPTFRNWFRPRYPYVYASFRCVRSDA
jgi:ergothioneine biosynthesis protein EgtB